MPPRYYAGHDFLWMQQFQQAIPKRRLIKCVALCLAAAIRHQYILCRNPNFSLSHATLDHFSVGRKHIRPYLLYFQEANLITVSFKKGSSPKVTLIALPTYFTKTDNKINIINGTGVPTRTGDLSQPGQVQVPTRTGLKNQIRKTRAEGKGRRQGTKGRNQRDEPREGIKGRNQGTGPRDGTKGRNPRKDHGEGIDGR